LHELRGFLFGEPPTTATSRKGHFLTEHIADARLGNESGIYADSDPKEEQDMTNLHGSGHADGRRTAGSDKIDSISLSAVHARQGVISGRVVTVLGISMSLAILSMVFSFVVSS
jgi:hypothetical protein